jgi:CDP-diacylglycerol--serine O-phosphatidyltransferase
MTAKVRTIKRRPDMRKAVFLFPSGLTLLNLFFGVFAIIAASRLEFTQAGVYVVLGGICDALDGRVARATNAGSQFGEELDSLVDAITFGLAPGMIMYFAVLNRGGWDWVWVFAFAAAAVLRLARFNIEQAGTAKTYFQGLPSPAAGITLASYYWFSQSWLYDYGRIANLNWHFTLRVLMAALAALMISNVPYPTFPRTGFRSVRAIGSTIIVFGAFALLLTGRLEYFFPIAVLYVALGLLRWMLSGLFERRQPTLPYDLSEGEDEEEEEDDEEFDLLDSQVHASRQGHRDDAPRGERPRGRASTSERVAETTPPRAERAPRKPERTERPAEPDRARRDKKKERPKRPDRAERPERSERPPRPETAAASPLSAPQPTVVTGVDAITLGEPVLDSVLGEEEELLGVEDATELESGASGVPSPDGAPTRKRKRRRRRGERKERGPASAESAGAGAPLAESDQSPYAATPPAYSPPTPEPSSPAPAPTSPAPSAPSSSSEPSE